MEDQGSPLPRPKDLVTDDLFGRVCGEKLDACQRLRKVYTLENRPAELEARLDDQYGAAEGGEVAERVDSEAEQNEPCGACLLGSRQEPLRMGPAFVLRVGRARFEPASHPERGGTRLRGLERDLTRMRDRRDPAGEVRISSPKGFQISLEHVHCGPARGDHRSARDVPMPSGSASRHGASDAPPRPGSICPVGRTEIGSKP
jgi:hypothetical protein